MDLSSTLLDRPLFSFQKHGTPVVFADQNIGKAGRHRQHVRQFSNLVDYESKPINSEFMSHSTLSRNGAG